MQAVELNNGTKMPAIGLGLWKMQDENECVQAIMAALAAGYRHFDTAQIYGNEAYLGKALARADIPRQELFLTTKIWNENQFWDDLTPSFEQSLKNMQTAYVDVLLLHFPVTELRRPAWRKMEELAQPGGCVKAIGVSNYTVRHLEELLTECAITPVVNQVELHVYLQQPALIEYCNRHGIVVEAYSPLAHGYGLDNPVLANIAAKYHKTPAQIMIRWCIDIATVPLPKSIHRERIEENMKVFDFKLSSDDMAELQKLDKNYRMCWDPTNVA